MKVLWSYHYLRNWDVAEFAGTFETPPQVFADSGAFSAYSQGADVTVDGYAGWLQRWGSYFSVYSNLDVIRNPDATAANQAALEAHGLSPIPVFHAGSPFSAFMPILERYRYVALGGLVGQTNAKAVMAWIAKCFSLARPYGTVFHGFGMTRHEALGAFPWYSVDSTSWANAHKYGRLHVWDRRTRRLRWVVKGHHGSVYGAAVALRDLGMDPAHMASKNYGRLRDGKSRDERRLEELSMVALNVRTWQSYEAWMRDRHGETGPAENPGPHIYLADSSSFRVAGKRSTQLALFSHDGWENLAMAS